ncbi:AAA family ATPase [Stenotrophomonas sp. S4]
MKLTLERVGVIKRASIELRGLTVLAGENDTGKSTIGKAVFALVQALSTFPIALAKSNSTRLRREIDLVYFDLRRRLDVSEMPAIRSLFSKLRARPTEALSISAADMERLLRPDVGDGVATEEVEASLHRIAVSWSRIEKIQREFERDTTDSGAIGRMIHKALSAEFSGRIQSSGVEPARISIEDGATEILSMDLVDEKVLSFRGGEPIGFRDVTLVEGPSIIQYYPLVSGYDGLSSNSRGAIPYHVVDLANKLRRGRGGIRIDADDLAGLCDVFDGEMTYDDDKDGFYLRRGTMKIPPVNVASGIKALSIIEILYKGDYVAEDALLVLDEPETNLHPSWQIAYAKAICALVDAGVKVLVTTHSPYMLEALREYSGQNSNAKFYMSRRIDGEVSYLDMSGDIAPIIEMLSAPLAKMLNLMDESNF